MHNFRWFLEILPLQQILCHYESQVLFHYFRKVFFSFLSSPHSFFIHCWLKMLQYLVLKNTWYVMFEKYGMGLRFPHTGKYFFIVWHLPNSRGGVVTTDVKLLLIQHKTIFLHHKSLPKTVIFCYISFNNQSLMYQG